jgi:ribosomal protein S18 acetylase RimI-like enzyme
MSDQPNIRQATQQDLPRLKEIIDESFPRFFRYFALHSVSDLAEPTLVYEADSAVVGFAKQIQFTIQQAKYGCILWVAVGPKHRRKGVASALTDASLIWQKGYGAKAVFASTKRSNRASLANLGKAGFIRVGFWGLWRLFGWRVFQFYVCIWFAPGEVVLAHF